LSCPANRQTHKSKNITSFGGVTKYR